MQAYYTQYMRIYAYLYIFGLLYLVWVPPPLVLFRNTGGEFQNSNEGTFVCASSCAQQQLVSVESSPRK